MEKSAIDREALVELYIGRGLSTTDIATHFGIGKATSLRKLHKFGIPVRERGAAVRLAVSKGKIGKRKDRVANIAGYWMNLIPGHHRADHQGYVKEHIAIWEKHSGRDLPVGSLVHHINGVKTDNRAENLRCMSTSEHCRFHVFARKLCGTGRKASPPEKMADCLSQWDSKRNMPEE